METTNNDNLTPFEVFATIIVAVLAMVGMVHSINSSVDINYEEWPMNQISNEQCVDVSEMQKDSEYNLNHGWGAYFLQEARYIDGKCLYLHSTENYNQVRTITKKMYKELKDEYEIRTLFFNN